MQLARDHKYYNMPNLNKYMLPFFCQIQCIFYISSHKKSNKPLKCLYIVSKKGSLYLIMYL